MSEEDYHLAKNEYLSSQKKTEEEKKQLEAATRCQSKSPLWQQCRKKILTASNFGKVINRKPHTGCESIVEAILYPKELNTPSIMYGKEKEIFALEALSKHLDVKIEQCGIFLDRQYDFLGATPDGVFKKNNDFFIVEVKCPYTCKDITPEEGVSRRFITFWDKSGKINKKHHWYFQVQGQLRMTQAKSCFFLCYSDIGIKIEEIPRCDQFWEQHMEEKLILFYDSCLLPELIDSRKIRNMPIKNPNHIVLAKEQFAKKKTNITGEKTT